MYGLKPVFFAIPGFSQPVMARFLSGNLIEANGDGEGLWLQLQWGEVEDGLAVEAEARGQAIGGGFEDAESIDSAAAEVDGGSLGKVAGGAGKFANAGAEIDALRQDLVVEDEVIGVGFERQGQEQGAAV